MPARDVIYDEAQYEKRAFSSAGVVAFTIYHDSPGRPTKAEILYGLLRRVAWLVQDEQELREGVDIEDTTKNY